MNGVTGAAPAVSVVIPACNEAGRVGETVRAVRGLSQVREVLVVDDGSRDGTAQEAMDAGAAVLRLQQNRGKGAALAVGAAAAQGPVLLFLDADLGSSAAEAWRLLVPVLAGEADMTVAVFPREPHRGGLGLVRRLAAWGIRLASGRHLKAPLSGQRALTREVLARAGRLAGGFGVEVGLTLAVLAAGCRVVEVPTQMRHRLTGRNPAAIWHRGRQFWAVLKVLLAWWCRKQRGLGERRRTI